MHLFIPPSVEIQRAGLLQKESPSDVQLHLAAMQGDVHLLRRVLDSGKVHVDSRDKVRAAALRQVSGRQVVVRLRHARCTVKHSAKLDPSFSSFSSLVSFS